MEEQDTSPSKRSSSSSSMWQRSVLLLLSGILSSLIIWHPSSPFASSSSSSSSYAAPETPRRKLGTSSSSSCETQCKDPPLKDLEYFHRDDLSSAKILKKRVERQRRKYINQLQKDYGKDAYLAMFEPEEEYLDDHNRTKTRRVSIGRQRILKDPLMLPKTKNEHEVVATEGPAWDRMVRKYHMKLLEIQLGILQERKNAKGICLEECSVDTEDSKFLRRMRRLTTAHEHSGKYHGTPGLYSKFTWVTGGHSAAAGHGNFFSESYTATMERALKPIMKDIGLDFIAKNYAMGGTESSEEVALCTNSIFGTNVDSISWDYGMTDGHDLWKLTLYAYRAARLSQHTNHRPSLIAIHQGQGHNLVLQTMQELGMTTLGYDATYSNKVVLANVPDTFGKSDKEIGSMPPFVQYLKCDGRIESGDPGCSDHKYNDTICENRRAKASWHPGWKVQALVGHELSLTTLEVLHDAIEKMIKDEPDQETEKEREERLEERLKGLDKREKYHYDHIFEKPIPGVLLSHAEKWWKDNSVGRHLTDMTMEPFFKDPVFCHTAILPSEQRFQGFLTENLTMTTDDIRVQTYEHATIYSAIHDLESPSRRSGRDPAEWIDPRPERDGQMILTKSDSERQTCDEHLNLDYKDYYFVSSRQDWRTLEVPNDSSLQHYTELDLKHNKHKGWILVCLANCDWGKCSSEDLKNVFGWTRKKPSRNEEPPSEEAVKRKGKAEIVINGEPVTEASDMHKCFALKNKKGHIWKPDKRGKYEFRVRVTNPEDAYTYVRFSSFILL